MGKKKGCRVTTGKKVATQGIVSFLSRAGTLQWTSLSQLVTKKDLAVNILNIYVGLLRTKTRKGRKA